MKSIDLHLCTQANFMFQALQIQSRKWRYGPGKQGKAFHNLRGALWEEIYHAKKSIFLWKWYQIKDRSQGWECPSVPLPSLSRAAQKTRLAGEHQLQCTRERDAPRQADTQRGRHVAHTTHTGMDSTAPGAHVGLRGDGDTVIPNTHTHTHTQACAHSDRETLTITQPAPLPAHIHTHRPT